MRIIDIKIFRFQIPLRNPLSIKGQKINSREGLIIRITDETQTVGWGEISPLPGLSKETLAVAQRQILRLKNDLIAKPLPKSVEHGNGELTKWLDEFTPCASVRFGLETAVLNLRSLQRRQPMAALISPHYTPQVHVNALLNGNTPDVVKEAKELIKQGFRAIKLKVGSQDLAKDIKCVQELSAATGQDALLRLDANQAWDLEEAIKFGEAVGMAAVEYIEEPLKDATRIPEFYDATMIPVALDESLSQHPVAEIKSLSGVETIIIKPTVQGGVERSCQLAREAKHAGLEIVLTSCFETGLGILALANMAACFSPHIPVGLDTRRWLTQDILLNPFPVEHGQLDISRPGLLPINLDQDLLKEISA